MKNKELVVMLNGLIWEPIKANSAIATKNKKLAYALMNWYFEHINNYRNFDEMILDKTHVPALEILGCVEDFNEDIDRIITLINTNDAVILRKAA